MDDFDDDEVEPLPLDRREAASVRRDLDDLAAFKERFQPEGFKGVSLFCQDCVEEHYYSWDMLENNLKALLQDGETPVHEPAYDPQPDQYVDWEYAQGYLDGAADAGGPVLPATLKGVSGCPWCGASLGDADAAVYCARCGQHLAPARIARALLERGMDPDEVAELLRGARVPPLQGLPTP